MKTDFFNSLFSYDECQLPTNTNELIKSTLDPHVDRPFFIVPDGTSQTKLSNTGRMGFWVERQFNIDPNNSQLPDTAWGEIKTVGCDQFKPCSIGTISRQNWQEIIMGKQDSWEDSFVYRKMKSTLYVFYSKVIVDSHAYGTMPLYTVKRFGLVDIDSTDREQLEQDWDYIVRKIKRSSDYGNAQYSGHLLKLTYKGDACYVYPSMSFNGGYLRDIYSSL